MARHDEVIKEILDWKRMPGSRAFQRHFNKFNLSVNQKVFTNLYQWFFSNLHFDNYTLDFDSTILIRYGEQEGAKRGYNPRKPGRKSHHPIMAFVSDCRMIANFWLRPGDSFTTNNFLSFLEDTLNLMSLFRQAVLGTKVQQFMKTLQYKVFAIGAYMIKDGNSRILKLSLAMKRREWFTGLWSSSQLMHWPFIVQT